ncbi:MAG: type II toxin-antitoxin system RelE/ParE family toxin [Bacteroidia bacterium]
MVKEIVWSNSAIMDCFLIFEYWNARIGNNRYSSKLDRKFNKTIETILRFPLSGRKFGNSENRFLVANVYLIIYFVTDMTIEILAVWDSRRNPDDLDLRLLRS